MPDTELSGSDADVAERMSQLPDDVLGIDSGEATQVDENVNEVEEPSDVTEEAAAQDGENEDEKGDESEAKAAEDPEFEIVDPANPENKQSLKLSELVQSHREYTAFKDQKDSILQGEQAKAREFSHQRMQQVEGWSQQVVAQLNAAMQMVQPPRPPDISMRDPRSPNYDPDRYEVARFQYEQGMQSYNQAQGLAQHLTTQAQALAAQRQAENETAELEKLNKAWPEFQNPDTLNAFVSDTQKHYGINAQELDAILVDHRQALVLRDALAFRKSKAAGGELQAKVKAKAPAKAVVQEGAKRNLSKDQAQHMQARKAMKESGGKDMNAAARAFLKYV